MRGIEPLTFSLPRKRSTPELHRLIPTRVAPCFDASGRRGSNSRPTAWKAVALPTELLPHFRYKSVVGASGLEPLNPKERIYSPPQLPLCDAPNKSKVSPWSVALLYLEPPVGIEPTTYWLQVSCSTSWAMVAFKVKNMCDRGHYPKKDCKNSIYLWIDKPLLHFLHINFTVQFILPPKTPFPQLPILPQQFLLYLCALCKNASLSP